MFLTVRLVKNSVTGTRSKMATKTKKSLELPQDLLTRLDNFFEKNNNLFFWIGMCCAFVFSILLFSVNMSEMGDDSGYVSRAFNLLKDGTFPSFQGPFYPMVLVPFIGIFGMKIVLLKILSMVFILLSLYFFWKAFKDMIPYTLLITVFILLCTNSYILYFSSQTFSEALYLMLQDLMFFIFNKYFIKSETDMSFKKDYIPMLLLGMVIFLGAITRNVHYGALVGIIVVFIIWKKWKSAIGVTLGFSIFYGIFEVVKRLFWSYDVAQLATQGKQLMYKDPYNAQAGMEDFSGYLTRFVENSETYISRCIYFISGLRPEESDVSGLLTIFTYLLLVGALILVFRKNKAIQMTIFYIAAICSVSFIVLQSFWGQWRLIAVFYPYILMALLAFFYYGLKKYSKFQFIFPLLAAILFFSAIGDTFSKIGKNLPVIQKNIAGDMFAGYTPDWKNFMLMSQWAAKNTPPEFTTASRKPEMSFIYTGRPFFGIYSVKEVALEDLKSKIVADNAVFGVDVESVMRLPFYGSISKFLFGVVQASDNTIIGLYQLSDQQSANVISEISNTGLKVDLSPFNTFETKSKMGIKLNCIDPDLLVKMLKDNKAKYMILPSIRMNPAENTGQILTTMHRYISWVQLKYPASLRLVHTIGKSEQAQLVEFDFQNMN